MRRTGRDAPFIAKTSQSDFAAGPKAVLTGALQRAKNDKQTRDEYGRNLLPLVYGAIKHPFDEAWATFEAIAAQLLMAL